MNQSASQMAHIWHNAQHALYICTHSEEANILHFSFPKMERYLSDQSFPSSHFSRMFNSPCTSTFYPLVSSGVSSSSCARFSAAFT